MFGIEGLQSISNSFAVGLADPNLAKSASGKSFAQTLNQAQTVLDGADEMENAMRLLSEHINHADRVYRYDGKLIGLLFPKDYHTKIAGFTSIPGLELNEKGDYFLPFSKKRECSHIYRQGNFLQFAE